jgi:hypothetical protein
MNRNSILSAQLVCLTAVLLLAGQAQAATTVSSNPVNGATGVPTTSQIVFTFSAAMNPAYIYVTYSNLTAGTLLMPPAGVWSAGNTVQTVTPVPSLPGNSVIAWYILGVDASFQPLAGATSGTFTTGAGSGGTGSGTNALTTFEVGKVYSWDQYSAGSPVADTNTAYLFTGMTMLASNRTANAISLTPPASSATTLSQNPMRRENYYYVSSLPTSSAFEAAFPQGTYTFNVSATASNQTVQVVLPAAMTQPNAPHLTNFVAAQSLNATQAFTLGWEPFVGGYSTDFVYAVISDGATNVWKTADPGVSGALNGTATTVTIPANSLRANSSYTATLGFYHVIIVSNATYVTEAYRATATQFTVNTIGTVRPVVTNFAWSGGHYNFDVVTSAGQTLTVVSSTNCALPLAQWPTLLTTNSPGTRVHVIDPRPAAARGMVYRTRNGT